MNISPISLFNLNGCNCPPKRREVSVFARNNACDSVSFSGNKSASVEPYSYSLETRDNARLPQGGDNRLDDKSREVLTELDERTNEVVEKANAVNQRAERARLAIMNALNGGKFVSNFTKSDGSYDVALDITGDQTLFAHVNNDYTVGTIYSHTVGDIGGASKSEKYTFDKKTQKLSEYLETDEHSSLTLQFDKNKIEGERIPKGNDSYKKDKFHINYNNLGEVITARFEDLFYDNTSKTRSIQKTAVGVEHSNVVGYALTEHIDDPYDTRYKGEHFMKWISYQK